ncbi:hypothetical protein LSM04_004358 [Trypanosoma melophagium]|uniref:uncharacterized protein n=1 Tax=Trypanosoma melophagium TaxID=715481 RepID=UPI00351A5B6F|nr:hypothetical protein LSM04_004358 [Trypanosoma melophagium]
MDLTFGVFNNASRDSSNSFPEVPFSYHNQRTDALALLPSGEAVVFVRKGNVTYLSGEWRREQALQTESFYSLGITNLGPYVLSIAEGVRLFYVPSTSPLTLMQWASLLRNDEGIAANNSNSYAKSLIYATHKEMKIIEERCCLHPFHYIVCSDFGFNFASYAELFCYNRDTLIAIIVTNDSQLVWIPFDISSTLSDRVFVAPRFEYVTRSLPIYKVSLNWGMDEPKPINCFFYRLVRPSVVRLLLIFDAAYFKILEFEISVDLNCDPLERQCSPLREASWSFDLVPLSAHSFEGSYIDDSFSRIGKVVVVGGNKAKQLVKSLDSFFIYVCLSMDEHFVAMTADFDRLVAVFDFDASLLETPSWNKSPLSLRYVVQVPEGYFCCGVQPYGPSMFVVLVNSRSWAFLLVMDGANPKVTFKVLEVGRCLIKGLRVDNVRELAVIAVDESLLFESGGVRRLQLPPKLSPMKSLRTLCCNWIRRAASDQLNVFLLKSSLTSSPSSHSHSHSHSRSSSSSFSLDGTPISCSGHRILKRFPSYFERRCPFGHIVGPSYRLVASMMDNPLSEDWNVVFSGEKTSETSLVRSSKEDCLSPSWICSGCSRSFFVISPFIPPVTCEKCSSVFCGECFS